ncbi:helix-turn-helix domain-containing protein [Mesobacillus subterraneus]|uniref:helix-turn-helix domain-containing protein n=1 Tax=Mesobacillus subterraneus TaxID=285983 RepID=UPI001472F9FB|nr:helix-turn-helix transcriptional regulator [Mesobacillus subterraneus]
MSTFGEKLRYLREKNNLSQYELAHKLEFANTLIPTYELGKKEPSLNHLELIADYFNVSVDYLLGRDEKLFNNFLVKPLNELLEKYSFYLEDEKVTKEEVIEAITYIKLKRNLMKDIKSK